MNAHRIQRDQYGEATEHVTHVFERIWRITSADFLDARGTRTTASECADLWLHAHHDLITRGGAERAIERLLGDLGANTLEFLRGRYPSRPVPPTLRIEWAEGPWELLVPADFMPDADGIEPWGVMRVLPWSSEGTLERLSDILLTNSPAIRACIGPPVWQEGLDGAMLLDSVPRLSFAAEGLSPRARAALRGLENMFLGVVSDALRFALFEPCFGVNPRAPELLLLEHGLVPLGIDDDIMYVFRYNTEPVATPDWLPRVATLNGP